MKLKTLATIGVSWLAVAGAAAAQEAPQTQEQRARTIEALEQRLNELEAQLEDLKAATAADVAEVRRVASEAPVVTIDNGRPTIASADGANRLAIRGLVQYDIASFDEGDNAAGVDLNAGANFRRARLGVEGTVSRDWNYALTAEYGGTGNESTQLNQAWIEYAGWKPFDNLSALRLRLGAWATPLNLEDATSNAEGLFLERPAAAELARAIAAGDGRYGVGAFLNGDRWYGSAVLTGSSIAAASPTNTFDEQQGYILRAAFLPLRAPDYALHLGVNASGITEVADTASGPATTQTISLNERPELRVDGSRFVDTGAIAAEGVNQYGVELGATWRNFYAAAEYITFRVDSSTAALGDPEFDGWYVQGAWTLTGERRTWNAANGGFQGVRPANPFSPNDGHWGAWEIAARYSVLDLNDNAGAPGAATPANGVRGGEQVITTLGLNWYPNRAIRFLLDVYDVDVSRLNGAGASLDADYQAVALRSQLSF